MPKTEKPIARLGFAERLVSWRESAGIKQSDMAARLGVPLSTYQSYEQARTWPRLDFLIAVHGLGADIEWLALGADAHSHPLWGDKGPHDPIDAHVMSVVLVELDGLLNRMSLNDLAAQAKAELIASLYALVIADMEGRDPDMARTLVTKHMRLLRSTISALLSDRRNQTD